MSESEITIYAFTCGWQTVPLRGFDQPPVRVPTPVFLIDHPEGLVLVDAGLHPDVAREPECRVGWTAKVVQFELGEDEDVASRLGAAGVELADIRYLVNTHLHFDHAGGNSLIPPTATLVVHHREWAAACDPREIAANLYVPADYADVRPRLEVEGEHDLYGDGTIVLFETFGHTPGHQSVRLRAGEHEVVLCGDACYFTAWLDSEEGSPIIGRDRAAERASLRRLRSLRDAGARIIVGHDPDLWATIPQAPEALDPAIVGVGA